MRVNLIDQATVKTLKLVYTPDTLTITGTVPGLGHGVDHEHEVMVKETPMLEEGETHVVPPHSFDPVVFAGTTQNVELDVEDMAFSKVITFADLRALPGFACHSQLALGVSFVSGELVVHETFSRSFQTKKRTESMEANHFYVLHVTVPCSSAKSFDECMVFCTADKDAFTFDGEFGVYTEQAQLRALVPSLKVEGPDAITQAGGRLVVTYAWPDGTPIVGAEVHSEVTAGYINRQRIHTNGEGKAYFTVLPLALDVGEKFRVKFGFKHFTGKADKVLSVS